MAQTLFPLLVNSPGKRCVMLPEGTHTIMMEKTYSSPTGWSANGLERLFSVNDRVLPQFIKIGS